MKNAIKLSLIIIGMGMLFYVPEKCEPEGEGEYHTSTHQVELVAPKTLKA